MKFRIDSAPVVLEGDLPEIPVLPAVDFQDGLAGRIRVLRGVGDQVGKHLPQALPGEPDGADRCRAVDAKPLRLDVRAALLDAFLDRHDGVEHLPGVFDAADAGQFEEVHHEILEAFDVDADPIQVVPAAFVEQFVVFLDEAIRHAVQGDQRGLEVMRDRVDEGFHLGIGACEALVADFQFGVDPFESAGGIEAFRDVAGDADDPGNHAVPAKRCFVHLQCSLSPVKGDDFDVVGRLFFSG